MMICVGPDRMTAALVAIHLGGNRFGKRKSIHDFFAYGPEWQMARDIISDLYVTIEVLRDASVTVDEVTEDVARWYRNNEPRLCLTIGCDGDATRVQRFCATCTKQHSALYIGDDEPADGV